MNRKRIFITSGTLVALAALALAHHVPVGLSYVSGNEILSEVIFFTSAGVFGVPAYEPGVSEAPDHGTPVGLVDGDSFSVTDHSGLNETITLSASDFADISSADMDEVVDAINAKATLFEASETNGFFVLRGQTGGASASLDVLEGTGGPLAKMGMSSGLALGSDDLELTISIPDPNLNLAGHTYVILASATDGSFQLKHHTVPIGIDGLTDRFLRAAASGAASGFIGTLDGNSDASAHLTADQLQRGFAGGYPDKLYFTYIVLDGPRIGYVSNQFVVDFQ